MKAAKSLLLICIGIVICLIILVNMLLSDINQKIEAEKQQMQTVTHELSNYTTVTIGENKPISVDELSAKQKAINEGYDEYRSVQYAVKKEYEGKTVKTVKENINCPYCDYE